MLIAEISNQHEGNLAKAKSLIYIAFNCGADIIKSQAFMPTDFKTGTMPRDFYNQCQFSLDEYKELVDYARSLGTDMFYTVLSEELKELESYCYPKKISAFQSDKLSIDELRNIDNERLVISFNNQFFKTSVLKKSKCLYAINYLSDWDVKAFGKSLVYNKKLGISDHSYGIDQVLIMIKEFNIPVIEKHFYLGDQLIYDGRLYRDCIHAANPTEFTKLAKAFKK